MFWFAAVQKQAEPWFEWVPSKANCSDAVSRGDFSYAKSQGWCLCNVEWDTVWANLRGATEAEMKEWLQLARDVCVAPVLRKAVEPLD